MAGPALFAPRVSRDAEGLHGLLMADDWTREEVEATAADYFDMLQQELQGLDYNKSAHRRHLATLLHNRSDGAIERKHQNISAVLIELGFVYISGYKPLRNYQQLLFEVVADRLDRSQGVIELVKTQIAEPVAVPDVQDILLALEEPPSADPDARRFRPSETRERPDGRVTTDYVALEARNRSLGDAGEEFVLRFEQARLSRAGHDRLASKVERVSATRGDGLGFDILSFEVTGQERLVEVKTTAYGPSTPFFVTKNELAVSQRANEQYMLYRAFNFRRLPRVFIRPGALDRSFVLDPSQFTARIG